MNIPVLLKIFTLLIAFDAVWLYIRSDYHASFFSSVQGGAPLTVRWIPAIMVYILLAIAILYVAIKPANSIRAAALRGALVGAMMYGFYDATNLATLRGWTWAMTITDVAWGALCSSLVSLLVYFHTI